ncbi:MAG: CPBP family intramembrane metalloprotease domain-containing protein [Pirellula sp.]|nr:CPBP family intramembrane metalloprotease domain-containing protein [Pirellula sp.]
MTWSNVRRILVREVRDQMRDRRTLFMIFVLPLMLYPLLGMSLMQVTQFVREQPTKVLLVGFKEPPDFPKLVRSDADGTQHFADELFTEVGQVRLLQLELRATDADPEQVRAEAEKLVQDGAFEAVVYFPPDFNEKLIEFRKQLRLLDESNSQERNEKAQPTVPSPKVFFNTAKEKSQLAYRRLRDVLDKWSNDIGLKNLASRNLPATTARPFEYLNDDFAEKSQREAAIWSKILPFLLLIWALTGAFYPAIDLCAGEKERGTLETLLSSPAERGEIVWGKLLTVMLFSVVTAVLNILSMGITGTFALSAIDKMGSGFGAPPPLAPIWLFLALLPMSAMFSALCIALASIARSTKEGQYYLMPLVLVTMPLVILPMAPGIELNLGMSLIPVSGVVLLLKLMLEGQYWEVLRYILPVAAVTGACCLLAIRWAVDQFNSENVLFRESERGGLGTWFRHLLRDREDTPSVAGSVFCGVLILTIYFFMNFSLQMEPSFFGFVKAVVTTQLVVVFMPTMMMTLITARSVRQTLLLVPPKLLAVPAAIVLAFALHPTALLLLKLLNLLYPPNPQVLESLKHMVEFMQYPSDWTPWILFAVMAVTPAVCEELAFRGFILSGFRKLGNTWRAIIFSALFFGASHGMAVQQAISASILGLLLGYLAVQSGSIFTGMFFHMTHNGLVLFLGGWVAEKIVRYPRWEWVAELSPEKDSVTGYHPFIVATGIIIAGAILRWFSRLPHPLSYEEELQEAIRERSEPATA